MGHQERRVELIAKRAAPHLEPGEQIQTGFVAQSGSSILTARVWTFVVTDRAILIVRKGTAQRLPRDFPFGEPSGMYHTFQIDRAYKVHRQYYAEIRAADAALRGTRADGDPPDGEPR
ncbi:hypothetical protein [Streptomyces synnematoformans]|uniref:Uncharacterized protein n=1 Tax=Streptomyces synnematoformans TaxID=415721 RepID=A0ABN2A358_9ACTN